VVTLIGNHEQMMASCLSTGNAALEASDAWYGFGGKETIKSYPDDPEELADSMRYHFYEFFEKLELFYDNGRQFFVHAGVDHLDLPLAKQSLDRMLWGSGSTHPHSWAGRYVVHGHIAQDIPRPIPNRNCINVDTHAYAGGPLSCAVFQNTGFGKPTPEKCCPIALICDGVVHELEVHN
jgi:serine/threonine protein phosphatase 1